MNKSELLEAIKARGLKIRSIEERPEVPEIVVVMEDGYWGIVVQAENRYYDYYTLSSMWEERFYVVRGVDGSLGLAESRTLMCGGVEHCIVNILREMKQYLKERAKELFRLSARTPALVLSDRYMEAGMDDEARILRLDSTMKRDYHGMKDIEAEDGYDWSEMIQNTQGEY